MISASDLKMGVVLRLDGELYKVITSEYHAGGGKMGGVAHAKLQNLRTGTFWERRFRPDEKLEKVELERVTMEYIYQEGDDFYFMNPETFEQIPVARQAIGTAEKFLQPEMQIPVEFFEGKPVTIIFPEFVDLKITTTAQPVHTQQDNVLKPATLENGMELLVSQFIKPGESIRVDVQSGKYLERVRHDEKKKP
ncbi:MAG: elongation factor P [Acidobacteriia bacterium]|nr:elongation factor P [Terriglobia bacterium]